MKEIKEKLLKSIEYAQTLVALLESFEVERHKVNSIVFNLFDLVDTISSVEIDIYNFLKEKQDEVYSRKENS